MVAIEKFYGGKEASADVPSVTEERTAGIWAAQLDCGVDCGLGMTGALYGDQEPHHGHGHRHVLNLLNLFNNSSLQIEYLSLCLEILLSSCSVETLSVFKTISTLSQMSCTLT